jgi:predicted small secreted protein
MRFRYAIMLLVTGVTLAVPSLFLVGCHTTEGFGRDLESAGEGLQDEAREERLD